MVINLPSICHRNYGLGLLGMVFQDIKISKFSGGSYPHTPLLKYDLSRSLDWTVCFMPELAS